MCFCHFLSFISWIFIPKLFNELMEQVLLHFAAWEVGDLYFISNNLWNEFLSRNWGSLFYFEQFMEFSSRSWDLYFISSNLWNFYREVGDLYFISNNFWNFHWKVENLYFISSNLWDESSSILRRYYILFWVILRVLVFLD